MKSSAIKNLFLTGGLVLIISGVTVNAQSLKDFDGNIYKIISYGMQTWTASNLNVAHFRNGDAIKEAKTEEEWINAGKTGNPAWCHYENNPDNGKMYGKLYNWFAVNDKRGLAPEGWHISANSDWSALIKNLKGVDIAGTKLKSAAVWKSKKGTNDIGFNALPSGFRDPDGKFRNLGMACQFWSNSVPVAVKPTNKIFSLMLDDNTVEAKYYQSEKGAGYSVRCEKD